MPPLDTFIGQPHIILPLRREIQACLKCHHQLPHMILYGAPGLGKDELVNSQKEILEKMYRDRFQQMFDTLYGSIVEEARDILEGKADAKTGQRSGVGSLETGSRRGGAVEKMLIIFDRVANFHQFTSPEVLDLVNQVRGKLKGKTYEDLNANGGDNKLTASVKGIMGELKVLVEQQWELQKSRVDRSIMI